MGVRPQPTYYDYRLLSRVPFLTNPTILPADEPDEGGFLADPGAPLCGPPPPPPGSWRLVRAEVGAGSGIEAEFSLPVEYEGAARSWRAEEIAGSPSYSIGNWHVPGPPTPPMNSVDRAFGLWVSDSEGYPTSMVDAPASAELGWECRLRTDAGLIIHQIRFEIVGPRLGREFVSSAYWRAAPSRNLWVLALGSGRQAAHQAEFEMILGSVRLHAAA